MDRAADDFDAIRARIEELRQEQEPMPEKPADEEYSYEKTWAARRNRVRGW